MTTSGWVIYNTTTGGWRASLLASTAYNFTPDGAEMFMTLDDVPMNPFDTPIPWEAFTAACSTRTGTTAMPEAHMFTRLSETAEDVYVSGVAGVLDAYADLADHRLDRHFRITVCNRELLCETRTVTDVLDEILDHIRQEHP